MEQKDEIDCNNKFFDLDFLLKNILYKYKYKYNWIDEIIIETVVYHLKI